MKANVLSLFDGCSCGKVALDRAGINYGKYYASEIDKYAIQVAKKNHPDIIHIGDVTKVKAKNLPTIHLLIGGSPCQGFSLAGKHLNFSDPRSKLFFEFVRLLKECKPTYFLLENVKMKKEYQDVITKYLKVEPIEINSELVSGQHRKRLYWTNIPNIKQPKDKGILFKDVILKTAVTERKKSRAVMANMQRTTHREYFLKNQSQMVFNKKELKKLLLSDKAVKYMSRKVKGGRTHWDFKHHSDIINEKSAAVVANFFKGVPYNVFKDRNCIRYLHPVECERLQTLPDGYTEGVSNTQRYKMLGNGWTVDVIAHIFKKLKNRKIR